MAEDKDLPAIEHTVSTGSPRANEGEIRYCKAGACE